MKTLLLNFAAKLLIQTFAGLDTQQIREIKEYIVELEGSAIDKMIKHRKAALLIKEIAAGLSDFMVDWVIRTVLWWARATA